MTLGSPTLSRPQIGLYFLLMTMLGISVLLVGPTLIYLAEQMHISLEQIGVLFLMRAGGTMLSSLLLVRAYDRMPGHRLLAVALVITGGLTFSIPLIHDLRWMMLIFLLIGISEAFLEVGTNLMVMWGLADRSGPALNGVHFMFGVGGILAPLLMRQSLLLSDGVAWAYYATAAAMLLLAIGLAFFRSPTNPQQAASHERTGGISDARLAAVFVLFFFAYVGAELGFANWIYTYALETGLADALQAATLNSFFWVVFTLGRLAFIPLSYRFRPRQILWFSLGLMFAALGSMLLFPVAFWWSMAALALAYAPMYPQALFWAQRRLRVTGQLNGWFLAGGSSSVMMMPWLIGLLFVRVGPVSLIWSVMAIGLLILLAVLLLTLSASDQVGTSETAGETA